MDSVVEDAGRRNPRSVAAGGDLGYLLADCGVEHGVNVMPMGNLLIIRDSGGPRAEMPHWWSYLWVWLGWWFAADIRLREISLLALLSWGSL